jgi:hypothetical protein
LAFTIVGCPLRGEWLADIGKVIGSRVQDRRAFAVWWQELVAIAHTFSRPFLDLRVSVREALAEIVSRVLRATLAAFVCRGGPILEGLLSPLDNI